MIMQEEDTDEFLKGQKNSTGKAPTKAQQAKQQKRQQINRAKEYIVSHRQGLKITPSKEKEFIPNKNARHRVT